VATYKLIQDIEAEDHILGPLTLRQFIFALIAVFCYYICFISITKHFAFMTIFFLPPALFFTFFAIPFGRDQPTEIWALAKLRFLLLPRKRIWDQSGVKELVTVTAPKTVERVFTDGLSQGEVKSRLSALANTIDSRGWAVKNVNVNAYAVPDPIAALNSDRLIDIGSIPQEVPNYEIQASDDILDERNNPIAQQFDQMIQRSNQAHRQQIVSQLNDSPAKPAPQSQPDYWFMQPQPAAGSLPPDQAMFTANPTQAPGTTSMVPSAQASADDEQLAAELKARNSQKQVSYGHLRTLDPLKPTKPNITPDTSGQTVATKPAQTSGPATPDPAILPLVSNNDLSVATLAKEAARAKGGDQASSGEVVISLR
jgi:hypothetical protein